VAPGIIDTGVVSISHLQAGGVGVVGINIALRTLTSRGRKVHGAGYISSVRVLAGGAKWPADRVVSSTVTFLEWST